MRKSVCVAFSLAILFACEKKEEETTVKQSNNTTETSVEEPKPSPIPLKIGNQWVYEYQNMRYDTSGNIIDTRFIGYDTITIISDTLINDQLFYKLDGSLASYHPNSSVTYTYLSNNEGVLKKYNPHNQKISLHKISTDITGNRIVEDNYSKVIYTTQQTDESYLFQGNYLSDIHQVSGEAYFKTEDSVYRKACADPYLIFTPSTGILYEEMYYSGCRNDRENNGLYKKLISFINR